MNKKRQPLSDKPLVKIGDRIMLITSKNGISSWEGGHYEVTSNKIQKTGNFTIKNDVNNIANVSYIYDDFSI